MSAATPSAADPKMPERLRVDGIELFDVETGQLFAIVTMARPSEMDGPARRSELVRRYNAHAALTREADGLLASFNEAQAKPASLERRHAALVAAGNAALNQHHAGNLLTEAHWYALRRALASEKGASA